MKNILFTIFFSTIIMISLDFIFISFILNDYKQMIFNIQKTELTIKYIGAFFCYIFLVSSLYYFILKDNKPVFDAFLLGIFIYGILETTNYSVIKKWDAKIAIMDTIWGGILFASTTFLLYKLKRLNIF
jgi:uncharacterized membrane protein